MRDRRRAKIRAASIALVTISILAAGCTTAAETTTTAAPTTTLGPLVTDPQGLAARSPDGRVALRGPGVTAETALAPIDLQAGFLAPNARLVTAVAVTGPKPEGIRRYTVDTGLRLGAGGTYPYVLAVITRGSEWRPPERQALSRDEQGRVVLEVETELDGTLVVMQARLASVVLSPTAVTRQLGQPFEVGWDFAGIDTFTLIQPTLGRAFEEGRLSVEPLAGGAVGASGDRSFACDEEGTGTYGLTLGFAPVPTSEELEVMYAPLVSPMDDLIVREAEIQFTLFAGVATCVDVGALALAADRLVIVHEVEVDGDRDITADAPLLAHDVQFVTVQRTDEGTYRFDVNTTLATGADARSHQLIFEGTSGGGAGAGGALVTCFATVTGGATDTGCEILDPSLRPAGDTLGDARAHTLDVPLTFVDGSVVFRPDVGITDYVIDSALLRLVSVLEAGGTITTTIEIDPAELLRVMRAATPDG